MNSAITKDDRFQLRVRTGSAQLDRVVYEFAYQQFADVLPIFEKEPYSGFVEITFASSDQSYWMSRSSSDAVGDRFGRITQVLSDCFRNVETHDHALPSEVTLSHGIMPSQAASIRGSRNDLLDVWKRDGAVEELV